MRINILLLALLFFTGCSPENSETSDPAFFKVDRFGNGPLTMRELQISVPSELAAEFADGGDCLIAKIEQFAAEAGDPQTLDPSTVELLSELDDWQKLGLSPMAPVIARRICHSKFFYRSLDVMFSKK